MVIPKPNDWHHPPLRKKTGVWLEPLHPSKSMIGPKEFIFFGSSDSLDICGWNSLEHEKLWRYNQHYFNDLNAWRSFERKEWHRNIIEDWIEKNPPTFGVGWEPYPTSLRIINWIKWWLSGNEPSNTTLTSLAMQVRFLEKRLEWHLLGNHILANAKALIFAGLFFDGREADRWLRLGLSVLERELREQILIDGGHIERSTMYQGIVLEDILDLINAANYWPSCIDLKFAIEWDTKAKKMIEWLTLMSHPDGKISFFNDAAFDVAHPAASLANYACSLGLELSQKLTNNKIDIDHLDASGYIRLSCRDAVAILDVAEVGLEYNPGHAHADTLSFELSVFGQRIVVNGGTSCYGNSKERVLERQTSSHSTVEIDGASSSHVWGGFRVAERAYPVDLKINNSGQDSVFISCSHTGYRRIFKPVIHRRSWIFNEKTLCIKDEVQGCNLLSIARFIFDPKVIIRWCDENFWEIDLPNKKTITILVEGGMGELMQAFYSPQFGRRVETQCLAVKLLNGVSRVIINWY